MKVEGTRWEDATLSKVMYIESTNPSKKHSGEYLHHSLVLEFISETGVRDFSELIDYAAKNDQAMFKTVLIIMFFHELAENTRDFSRGMNWRNLF